MDERPEPQGQWVCKVAADEAINGLKAALTSCREERNGAMRGVEMISALLAQVTEERDRAQAELREAMKLLCPMCKDGFPVKEYPGGWFHEMANSVKYSWPYGCHAGPIQAALKPVSDRQPEGETK